ncbi:MAG: hypothetical protein HKN16_10190, partial [Saprospiraceae bacterium]|nr:hypothetical protein [Saprospiraceae bacterium]
MKSPITLALLFLSMTFLSAQELERVYPTAEVGTVTSIAIHPSGLGYATQECGLLLKTTDGGSTWQPSDIGLSDESYFAKIQFLDDNDSGKMIYTGTYGLFYTEDGWASYENVNPPEGTGLIRDFVVMGNGEWGLIRSSSFLYTADTGETWSMTDSLFNGGFRGLVVGEKVYITGGSFIRESTDYGKTWHVVFDANTSLRNLVQVGNEILAIGSSGFIFASTDGQTWASVDPVGWTGSGTTLIEENGTLFSSTSNRLYISTDAGRNWTAQTYPDRILRTASVFLKNDGTLLVGGQNNLLVSFPDPTDVTDYSILFGKQGNLRDISAYGNKVVAIGEEGVYVYSDDGGSTWTESNVPSFDLNKILVIKDRVFAETQIYTLAEIIDNNSQTEIYDVGDNTHSFEYDHLN